MGDGNLNLDLGVEWRSLAAQDPEDGRRKEGDVEPDGCVGQVLKNKHAFKLMKRHFSLLQLRFGNMLSEENQSQALFLSSFLGPKWHSLIGSMSFHRDQKTLNFQGPTPSHLPT